MRQLCLVFSKCLSLQSSVESCFLFVVNIQNCAGLRPTCSTKPQTVECEEDWSNYHLSFKTPSSERDV